MTNSTLNGTFHQRTTTTEHPKSTVTGRRASNRTRLPKADRVLFLAAAAAPWGLAILLLAVSTPHLASGFQTICNCGPLAGWLLAVAIDAAQVTAKLQMTVMKQYATTEAARWTAVGIVCGTSLMSMSLNVLAFLAGVTDKTGTILAWSMGIMLPLLTLALSYTGSCFALAKAKRAPKVKGREKK